MKDTAQVAVLMGGPSSEHDVSLNSGGQVLAALQGTGAVPVVISKNGVWTIDGAPQASVGRALDWLKANVDVVFVALHGPFGEDGTVQGLLEGMGLAYTGSGVAASSLAMDKARSKLVYRAIGLETPEFAIMSARPGPTFGGTAVDVRAAAERLGAVVVKPLCNGSSFGVSFPESVDALVEAVAALHEEGLDVLLEQVVRGTELTCGVLELDGSPVALPVTEIVPTSAYAFFDYEAKYTPGATDEITPARIDDALRDAVQAMALRAHQALGCRDMSRTDFMVDPATGRPFALETNTIPGFTQTSLLPQAAQVHGLGFAELVGRLVENARGRRRP